MRKGRGIESDTSRERNKKISKREKKVEKVAPSRGPDILLKEHWVNCRLVKHEWMLVWVNTVIPVNSNYFVFLPKKFNQRSFFFEKKNWKILNFNCKILTPGGDILLPYPTKRINSLSYPTYSSKNIIQNSYILQIFIHTDNRYNPYQEPSYDLHTP